ncbi:hypothetical protein ACDI16_04355 [Oceanobacillus caeni]
MIKIKIINAINHYFFDLEKDEQLPIVSDAMFFIVPMTTMIIAMPILGVGIWFT